MKHLFYYTMLSLLCCVCICIVVSFIYALICYGVSSGTLMVLLLLISPFLVFDAIFEELQREKEKEASK
jgi:hypothetical protein